MSLDAVHAALPDGIATYGIPVIGFVGIVFAIFLWNTVSKIRVRGGGSLRSENGREYLLEEEQRGESEVRTRAIPIETG